MTRGFAAIGLMRPKHHENVGSVLRAAYVYRASMVAIQGDRTDVRSITDTPKAWRHIPVLRGEDLHALIPYDAVPIAVDLVDDAESLPSFQHPHRAFYVFGPEDGTLGASVLNWCKHRIMVPTRGCMNLAATVNVVLYDRLAKADRQQRGIRYSDTYNPLQQIAGLKVPLSAAIADEVAFRALNDAVTIARDAIASDPAVNPLDAVREREGVL